MARIYRAFDGTRRLFIDLRGPNDEFHTYAIDFLTKLTFVDKVVNDKFNYHELAAYLLQHYNMELHFNPHGSWTYITMPEKMIPFIALSNGKCPPIIDGTKDLT